jgi:hypothetical protein
MVLIVIGALFAVLAGSGAWYDHRKRRKGERVSVPGDFTRSQTSSDLTRYERR